MVIDRWVGFGGYSADWVVFLVVLLCEMGAPLETRHVTTGVMDRGLLHGWQHCGARPA